MVNDTEPRYRLVDADGNVVGSLFAESDGTLKIQEGTSGSDNEVSVATDGTFNAPAVSTVDAEITNGTASTDPTNPTEWATFGDGAVVYSHVDPVTVAGDNTATTIYSMAENESGKLIIMGESDAGDYFTDEITVGGARLTTPEKADPRGTPGTRTYTRSGFEVEVAIDDSGASYEVVTLGIGGEPQ